MPGIRATVYFSGAVQGVGFRYTTRRLADSFDVTGTVQNLTDGRVKLVAEGPEIQIREWVDRIESSPGIRVSNADWEITSATGEFSCFEIVP